MSTVQHHHQIHHSPNTVLIFMLIFLVIIIVGGIAYAHYKMFMAHPKEALGVSLGSDAAEIL